MDDDFAVIKNGAPVPECPHCGCKVFYIKQTIAGKVCSYMDMHGRGDETGYNSDIYESTTVTGGKRAYCGDCHAYLGKYRFADSE